MKKDKQVAKELPKNLDSFRFNILGTKADKITLLNNEIMSNQRQVDTIDNCLHEYPFIKWRTEQIKCPQ